MWSSQYSILSVKKLEKLTFKDAQQLNAVYEFFKMLCKKNRINCQYNDHVTQNKKFGKKRRLLSSSK